MTRSVLGLAAMTAALLATASGARADFGLKAALGGPGTAPGQFFRAAGVAFDPPGTHLYVADNGNNRVQRLSVPDGAPDAGWQAGGTLGTRGPAATPLDHPIDVAVDGAGNLYVLEGTDPFQPGFGQSWLLHKYDAAGTWLKTWGDQGTAAKFTFPAGVAAHTDGGGTVVYVAEGRNEMNERVQAFDADGTFLRAWGWGVKDGSNAFQVCTAADAPCQVGIHSQGDGGFRRLMGIATDAAGTVWTVDGDARRVQKFSPAGSFLGKFDVSDPESSDCCTADRRSSDFPGIDAGASLLFVLDVSGGPGSALRAFTPAGDLQAAYTERCARRVHGLGAHPQGDVYVGSDDQLLRFGDPGPACNEALAPPPPQGGGQGGGAQGAPAGMSFNGREGITIEEGALFTNDPTVTLGVAAPVGATDMLVSNDGGFADPIGAGPCATGGPGTCKAPVAGRFEWTLRESGLSERLPRTVYVRFANANGTSAQTFTDDIILDATPPTTTSATLTAAQPASGAAAAKVRKRRFLLRVRARDNVSGVGKVQLAVRRAKPERARKYKPRLTIRRSRPPRFVRVRDRAGNVSKWRRIRRV